MRLASEAVDLEETKAGIGASPSVGDGCAGPRKPSMRLFQASQAGLSASRLAAAARCAEILTSVPYIRSRD